MLRKARGVMPDPWFRAQNTARCIAEFARPGMETYHVARENERQLGPFVLPPFQRPPVWTRAQQIKLIESLWDGLPIGSYVYNQTSLEHPTDGWLLDGQQRVTAILSYVGDGFPVYGYLFSEVTIPERRGFMNKPIGAMITNIKSEEQCLEVYNRLAYGGTAHGS
jgi:hypothetical protein